MPEVTTPGERVVILHARFAAYEALLDGLGENAGARIAYDGEALELMSPSADHERYNRLLEGMVQLLALEWRLDVESTGSLTLTREPHGAEPDSSFYVENAALMRGKKQLDLTSDPPPDLVVEIDVSRARLDKTTIYEALGVPEFWRYDGSRLRAFALRAGAYAEITASERFPGLPIGELNRYLEMRSSLGRSEILRAWRDWLDAHRPAERS